MLFRIFSIIFPVAAIVVVGYFYARRRPLDMESVNRVTMDIFFPALVFSVLTATEFELARYANLALGAIGVILGSGIIAFIVARVFGFRVRTFLPPMMFNNCGNMGLPLAVFAFGEVALNAAVVLMIVSNFFHFLLSPVILSRRFRLGQIIKMPMILATFAGLGVSVMNWEVPNLLATPIEMLGRIAVPLVLFSLGVRLTQVRIVDWPISLIGAILCPLAGLVSIWLVLPWLNLSGLDANQLILFSALPPAVINYIFAEQFRQEPQIVASIVMLGNILALAIIPLVLPYVLS